MEELRSNTWLAQARSTALSARGLIGCTGALRVWGVDDSRRHPRTPGTVVHRVGDLEEADGRLVSGVPVTGPLRSIIDSGAMLSANQLDATIDAAVRQRLVTIGDLQAELDRIGTAGRKGAGRLRRLLDQRDPTARVPDSVFNRLVGQLLIAAGLPRPAYEWQIRRGGRFAARADLAYPNARLAIEGDSERWHRNRRSFVADPRRKKRMMVAGYRVLTFTWDDYATQPDALVATVASALDQTNPRFGPSAPADVA